MATDEESLPAAAAAIRSPVDRQAQMYPILSDAQIETLRPAGPEKSFSQGECLWDVGTRRVRARAFSQPVMFGRIRPSEWPQPSAKVPSWCSTCTGCWPDAGSDLIKIFRQRHGYRTAADHLIRQQKPNCSSAVQRATCSAQLATRAKSMCQLGSHVTPPSGENAWSQCADAGVIIDQRKRTLIGRPSNVSSPMNVPTPSSNPP